VQILLGLIIGAVVGLAAHFALPHRDLRGVALAPLAGAAASGISWTTLTWVGFASDSPIPWIVAIVAPVMTMLVLIPALSRVRQRDDAALRSRAGI
jgi:Na+/proline symporter